jgi:hypothetical protein
VEPLRPAWQTEPDYSNVGRRWARWVGRRFPSLLSEHWAEEWPEGDRARTIARERLADAIRSDPQRERAFVRDVLDAARIEWNYLRSLPVADALRYANDHRMRQDIERDEAPLALADLRWVPFSLTPIMGASLVRGAPFGARRAEHGPPRTGAKRLGS